MSERKSDYTSVIEQDVQNKIMHKAERMLSIAGDDFKLQCSPAESGQATRYLHIHMEKGKNNKRRERENKLYA